MDPVSVALLCLVSAAVGALAGGALANREAWLGGLRQRVASRAIVVWAPAIAFVLAMPSLGAGLHPEDYGLRTAALRGATWQERWFTLFGTWSDDAGAARVAKTMGAVAWYGPEHVHVRLGRPLASVTHKLDFTLFDRWPWVMHLHSIAWFMAVVIAVALVYRRMLPSALTAGLAALLYAVDYTHAWPAGWLANRNALVSAAFAFFALVLHDRRARSEDQRSAASWPAALLLGLALLGGEVGVSGFAYLVAYAAVLDRRAASRRVAPMLPYAVVLAAWVALYRAAGYGSHLGSVLYVDPLERPLPFLRAVATRLPEYLFLQASGATFDAAVLSPWWSLVNGLALAGIVLLLPGVLRRSREARFFALGSVLSLIPLCAVPVGDRQLVCPAMGAMALFAQTLASVFEREHGVRRSRPLLVAAAIPWACVVLVHLVLSPFRAVLQSSGVGAVARGLEARSEALFAGAGDTEQITVVRGTDMWGCALDVGLARARGVKTPARCLSATSAPVEISREDGSTLVVRPARGFVDSDLDRVFWDDRQPLARGQTIDAGFARITVTDASPAGEPLAARFRFPGSLDDPKHRWMVWRGVGYEPFALPRIGETVVVR